jgi:hypothetical protein
MLSSGIHEARESGSDSDGDSDMPWREAREAREGE